MPKNISVMDADAKPVDGITVSIDNGRSDGEGRVSGTVAVADSVPVGSYTITVTETDDPTVTAHATLKVTAKPTPDLTVTPASTVQGGEAVSLAGNGFHPSADVSTTSSAAA